MNKIMEVNSAEELFDSIDNIKNNSAENDLFIKIIFTKLFIRIAAMSDVPYLFRDFRAFARLNAASSFRERFFAR